MDLVTDIQNNKLNDLPCNVNGAGHIVEFNGVTHLFTTNYLHYVYDSFTDSWSQLDTMPFLYAHGLVIFNNAIHIFSNDSLYKYEDGEYTLVCTLPVSINHRARDMIKVYNGRIYLIYYSYFYSFNGESWTSLGTPYVTVSTSYYNKMIIKNDVMYIFYAASASDTNIRIYNITEQTWTDSFAFSPTSNNDSAVIWSDKYNTFLFARQKKMYTFSFDDNTWSELCTLDFSFGSNNPFFYYQGENLYHACMYDHYEVLRKYYKEK